MKNIFTLLFLLISTQLFAQYNPLANTNWRLEKITENGVVRFKKNKILDFTNQELPFYGLKFNEDLSFQSGNICGKETGYYRINDDGVVTIGGNDGYRDPQCKQMVVLDGTFNFVMGGSVLELTRQEDADEPDEADEELAQDEEEEEEARPTPAKKTNPSQSNTTTKVAAKPKYNEFKAWVKEHLGSDFFHSNDITSNQNIIVSLYINDSGKARVKEILGTKDEALKNAIIGQIGSMPAWSAEEVDFNTTIKMPLRFSTMD